MRVGQRTRSTVKWTGTVVTVLLLILWVASGWWDCDFQQSSGQFDVAVGDGMLLIIWRRPPPITPSQSDAGWSFGANATVGLWSWFHYYDVPATASLSHTRRTLVYIPLWFIALLPGLPTGWLWWRDRRSVRRRRLGQCIKCGYDLRGTPSTEDGVVCPECGEAA